ncbi:MAG: FtsQ-type POTRA domain-containing protein [bacterium]
MSPSTIATPAGRVRRRGRTQARTDARRSKEAETHRMGLWVRRAVFAGVFLALFFGTDALYRWSMASPYFRVEQVEVSGTAHLSRSVVRARLGLRKGDNLLALELETLRLNIESHPWVRSASLSRNLPGTLRVEVAERKPWAVFASKGGGGRYLIDEEGVILAQAGAGAERFPVLRGLGAGKPPKAFKAGQALSGRSLHTGLAAIRAYRAVWPKVRRRGVRLAAVDLAAFSTEGTVLMDMLGPKGQATLVRLSPRDAERGLRRFAALIRHWRGRPWPAEVNLSMGSRVIVR